MNIDILTKNKIALKKKITFQAEDCFRVLATLPTFAA